VIRVWRRTVGGGSLGLARIVTRSMGGGEGDDIFKREEEMFALKR
jgi:hypothetical protein